MPPPAPVQSAVAAVRDERRQLGREAGLAADPLLVDPRFECHQVGARVLPGGCGGASVVANHRFECHPVRRVYCWAAGMWRS